MNRAAGRECSAVYFQTKDQSMALSNVFREPRREITETLVGVGVVVLPVTLFFFLDYHFAVWLFAQTAKADGTGGIPLFAGMVLGTVGSVMGGVLTAMLSVLVHAIGEDVCDALQRGGIHLRPRERY